MKRKSLESNLIALSLTTGGVVAVLLAALFAVAFALGARLERLQTMTLPAQQGAAGMQRAVARLFEREVQLQATSSVEQLAGLADRNSIEQELSASEANLAEALPNLLDEGAAAELRASLRDKSRKLLSTDRELYDSLARRHAAQAAMDRRISELTAELQRLHQDARAIAGIAHLEYVLQLRRVAQTGASADLQKVVYGEERAKQEAAEQVVTSVLQLGQLVGEVALAKSQDDLNSVAANELAQSLLRGRTRLARLLGSFDPTDPNLERTKLMGERFEAVAVGITDDRSSTSLLPVRRAILREAGRAVELQAQLLASETAFSEGLGEVQAVVAAEVARSTRLARTTQWVVQLASFCLLGLAAWFGWRAARQVKDSVARLRTQNHELESLSQELRSMNEGLEDAVAVRSVELAKREKDLRRVLDAMDEGLISVGLDGKLTGEGSKAALAWFGKPTAGSAAWSYLLGQGHELADAFELGYEQLTSEALPFEAAVGCLPERFERGGRSFALEYRAVYDDGKLTGVLLVVRDITARIEAERGELDAREKHTLLAGLLRDKQGFMLFLQDCRGLLRELSESSERDATLRALHTLKGNTAMYGVESVARLCHELEGEILESGVQPVAQRLSRIHERFELRMADVEELTGSESAIELSQRDFEELRSGLQGKRSPDELLAVVDSWRWLPTAQLLGRLASQARRVASRLDKSVEVSVEHHDLRIAPGHLDEFISSLVHVLRNALDHGLEPAAERGARGKPAQGRLQLRSYLRGGEELVVEIEDDGRGIDFAAVKLAAERVGLRPASQGALVEALLTSGVTTRREAGDLSGRGVGLDAVAQACRKAGGQIRVESEAGRGSLFRFSFPRQEKRVRSSLPSSNSAANPNLQSA